MRLSLDACRQDPVVNAASQAAQIRQDQRIVLIIVKAVLTCDEGLQLREGMTMRGNRNDSVICDNTHCACSALTLVWSPWLLMLTTSLHTGVIKPFSIIGAIGRHYANLATRQRRAEVNNQGEGGVNLYSLALQDRCQSQRFFPQLIVRGVARGGT